MTPLRHRVSVSQSTLDKTTQGGLTMTAAITDIDGLETGNQETHTKGLGEAQKVERPRAPRTIAELVASKPHRGPRQIDWDLCSDV